MDVRVHPEPDATAAQAARFVAAALDDLPGPVTLGLAGGGTPRAVHAELRDLDPGWSRVTCWLGDERWVPPDHPDSNTAMAEATLLDHVPAALVAPDTTTADPETAAARYELALEQIFVARGGVTAPDVVMLGVGTDGHTASLFPGTRALSATGAGYVANWVDSLQAWRLTATAALLSAARAVVFVATGAAKAEALYRIISLGDELPARAVAAQAAAVTWFVDAAAADRL